MKEIKLINKLADRFYNNKILRFLFLGVYRKFYTKGIDVHKKKVFNERSTEVFALFDSVMKEIGCEYWLTFGTLLGAIREKNIIKHDFDMDVAMFLNSRPKEFEKLMAGYGFVRSRYIIVDDGSEGFEETYTYNEISIDIFYFKVEKDTNKVYCYDFISDPQLTPRESMQKYGGFLARKLTLPFNGLMDYEFLNCNVKIPSNYEQYLMAHYGEDFMIPNPNWSSLTSPIAKIVTGKVGKLFKS